MFTQKKKLPQFIYKGPRHNRIMPDLVIIKEINQEPTPYCGGCGLRDTESVGIHSEVLNKYLCQKCISQITIEEADRLAGNRLHEFLLEL